MLGKLEELVLLSVIKTGSRSVPSAVYEQFLLASETEKLASFGSVYTTLERLAKKGLLDLEKIPDENGRKRKSYSINSNGRIAVTNSVAKSVKLGSLALAGG